MIYLYQVKKYTTHKQVNRKVEIIMTDEKRLNDYKGFQHIKVTDNKGLSNEEVTYIAYDEDGELFDADSNLTSLKKKINVYAK